MEDSDLFPEEEGCGKYAEESCSGRLKRGGGFLCLLPRTLSFKDPSETNSKKASAIVDKLGSLPLAIESSANRGLGLGLLKAFKEQGYNVFGTVRPQTRSDPSFKELEATGDTIFDLDYLDEDSITAAAQSYSNNQALDVLINCGGIEMYPESWLETTADALVYKYRVMTVGPFLVRTISQLTGSAGRHGLAHGIANDSGTHISYRVPKSALNALSISIAIELRAAKENIAVLCVDPGDVPIKLSRWAGDVNLNDSVRGMYEQIEKATIGDTGLFVNWRGHKWPY
ncbi:hypothetical protein LMH87_001606 [Akanthomyces muscarius]|uniref:Uncharacterized protein n=1 Tax=Akanthomyces muscarius TaxID=2231603 RepID=A0A9W8UIT7_AKAMU|nr:hypothetical protein LMH87_001606 [Akanthomyces muscarius]KAJ4147053.1 hypothetical protein LMH87_001606 [Akanthomyces muscarius]